MPLVLNNKFVTRKVYLEKMGNTHCPSPRVFRMAMDGHHPLSVEAQEKHTVAVPWRSYGLGFLNPRSVKATAPE